MIPVQHFVGVAFQIQVVVLKMEVSKHLWFDQKSEIFSLGTSFSQRARPKKTPSLESHNLWKLFSFDKQHISTKFHSIENVRTGSHKQGHSPVYSIPRASEWLAEELVKGGVHLLLADQTSWACAERLLPAYSVIRLLPAKNMEETEGELWLQRMSLMLILVIHTLLWAIPMALV